MYKHAQDINHKCSVFCGKNCSNKKSWKLTEISSYNNISNNSSPISTMPIWNVTLHPYLIKKYFENTRVHDQFENIEIARILYYDNIEFDKRFQDYIGDKRILLWHGTLQNNLESIYNQNFKLPTNSGMFGKGIYFADRATKSIQYTDCGRNGAQSGTLLLCEVAVGHMLCLEQARYFNSPPDGYQSVKGLGREMEDECGQMYFNKILVPLGETIPNPEAINSKLKYNEYIIYDPNRVIIRYVIEISTPIRIG